MAYTNFFVYNRLMVRANRGPFPNTAPWVIALLETETASLNRLPDVDYLDFDPELRDSLLYKDRDLILRNYDRMLALVPLIFTSKKEEYVLRRAVAGACSPGLYNASIRP